MTNLLKPDKIVAYDDAEAEKLIETLDDDFEQEAEKGGDHDSGAEN